MDALTKKNVAAWDLTAWGQVLHDRGSEENLGQSGATFTAGDFRFRWQTKGHEPHGAPLVYFGFRFYHSGLGRFLNRDPLGAAGGPNLHACARNHAAGGWEFLGLTPGSWRPFLNGGLGFEEEEEEPIRLDEIPVTASRIPRDAFAGVRNRYVPTFGYGQRGPRSFCGTRDRPIRLPDLPVTVKRNGYWDSWIRGYLGALEAAGQGRRVANAAPAPACPATTFAEHLDAAQEMLDYAGLAPFVGEPADGLSAVISLVEGDLGGAALSGGAMLPFAGWGFGGMKLVGKFSPEAIAAARKASMVDPKLLRDKRIDVHAAKIEFLLGTPLEPRAFNIGRGVDGTVVLVPVRRGGDPFPTNMKWEDFLEMYRRGAGGGGG